MKNLISILICTIMIFSLFGNAIFVNAETQQPPGAGTASDPFRLSTPAHLEWINGCRERLSKHYLVVNDIVAPHNLVLGYNVDNESSVRFTGVFDGGGHTITVNIDSTDIRNFHHASFSLFRWIGSAGIVRNLVIDGSIVNTSRGGGGISGSNNGTIKNVLVIANIYSDNAWVGGIVGSNGSTGTIINSYFAGAISGSGAFVGGIAGTNSGRIENSYVIGCVTGDIFVGGISGINSGLIENSVVLSANLSILEDKTAYIEVGRIWSYVWGGTENNNNHTRYDTLINGEPFDGIGKHDNQHGESVTAEVFHTLEFWRDTMVWDFTTVWKWNEETRLPILRNISGEQNHRLVVGILDIDVTDDNVNIIFSAPDSTTIIIAFFDGNIFLNAVIKHREQSGRIEDVAFPANTSNANRIKVMLWSNTETMNPLSNYGEITRHGNDWE